MTPRPWSEQALDALERERASRAAIPDFAVAPPIAKTRWRDAAKPLGFAPDVEELSTGRVNRLRLRNLRVMLAAVPEGDRLRLSEVMVELTAYHSARATLVDGAQVVTGAWSEVNGEDLTRIEHAVAALVGELPRHAPPPPDAWLLAGQIPRGPGDNRVRCLVCHQRLEEKLRLSLGYHPRERPDPGTSAWQTWQTLRVRVGLVHLACAAEVMHDLLADAIATCDWAAREPGLTRFLRRAAKITRGGLARCAACSKPLPRQAWRLEQPGGSSPLHIACARQSAPEALAQALTRTPAGFSEAAP